MRYLYVLFTAVIVFKVKANKPETKHNVLFIFVDDLRPLAGESVTLHNIEKLAAKGVSFGNAFAQQALCAPSRNSILTGRRPDALRLYDFYSYWRTFAHNFTTLPQFFKQNGYDTYSVGKVFHPGETSNYTDDYPYSWSDVPYHAPTEKFKDTAVCKDYITRRMQRNLLCPVTVEEQPGKSLPDLQTLDHALGILKGNKTKPYFLAVGFHKPHIPLKFPKEYLGHTKDKTWQDSTITTAKQAHAEGLSTGLKNPSGKGKRLIIGHIDKIPIDKVKLPQHPNRPSNMPLVAWHPWTDIRKRDDIHRLQIPFPMGLMPKKWTLKIRQNYYAAATYIDDLIGKLLSYVDRKKTIIVLTSDHGWSLGENGLWAKYSNFDVALKVPLIFSMPKLSHKLVATPVELIDIYPTLIELAGLPKAPRCKDAKDKSITCTEGRSLVPIMRHNRANGQENAFAISQYPRPSVYPEKNSDKPRLKDIQIMGYSIRTKRFRYTEWISFNSKTFERDWKNVYGIELYDHLNDLEESNNASKEPQYKYIKKYLSKLLRSQIDPS